MTGYVTYIHEPDIARKYNRCSGLIFDRPNVFYIVCDGSHNSRRPRFPDWKHANYRGCAGGVWRTLPTSRVRVLCLRCCFCRINRGANKRPRR